MKKATLAKSFAALRAERGLTLMEVANSCDLAQTTVLKVEAGRSVRWETLHLILTVGMNVLPGSEKYEAFHRLWLMHRAEIAEGQAPDFSAKKLSKHAAAAMKNFRALIRDLDEVAVEKVLAAATKASTKL
jgi:transcriptional regulator with XRE-family HTH domain